LTKSKVRTTMTTSLTQTQMPPRSKSRLKLRRRPRTVKRPPKVKRKHQRKTLNPKYATKLEST